MTKRRGYPDRRGMGAQSDFISEPFRPSAQFRTEQIARAKSLIAIGLQHDQVAAMLSLSVGELQEELTQPDSSN